MTTSSTRPRSRSRKGTKVTFKWIGTDKHNVVKAKGPGGSFSSGTTDQTGFKYKHKFKKAGTYKLICTVHDGHEDEDQGQLGP